MQPSIDVVFSYWNFCPSAFVYTEPSHARRTSADQSLCLPKALHFTREEPGSPQPQAVRPILGNPCQVLAASLAAAQSVRAGSAAALLRWQPASWVALRF